MTVSFRTRCLLVLLVASVCAITPQSSFAQWWPWQSQTSSETPADGAEAGGKDTAPPAGVAEQWRGAAGVEREELNPIMSQSGSGLPHELWSGLSAGQLAEAISVLALPPRSPALHALWRRLIISDAPAADGASQARFTALRVEALDQSGMIAEAAALLARDPAATRDPLLTTLAAKSEIGLGNVEHGCDLARGLAQAHAELPKPIQADALLITGYCAAQRGDMDAAALQARLIRGLDLGDLPGVDLLDRVTAGLDPELPAGQKLTPLDFRIASLKGSFPRDALIRVASPALLAALAHDPRSPADVRLQAGEAAALFNALPPRDLAPLYRAQGAGGKGDAAERAGLFQAVEQEITPENKAHHVRAFLDHARRAALTWPALAVMSAPVQQLRPNPDLAWFSETAIEVSLAAGDFETARNWARLTAPSGAWNPDASSHAHAHWMALADIAEPTTGVDRGRHLGAVEALARQGRLSPALLHRLTTVLDALDMTVPPSLSDLSSQTPQPAGGHLPDTGVLTDLTDASRKMEFGRTVLLVMRTIGPGGAEQAHVIALGDAIRALRRAGLETDARRLAFEGLFGAWPRAVAQ
ncbi:hypothetical protein W911_00630 [Hyphomicrobium nitrativorans NL23]|uniref:Antifreeze glycopeptide polyprotein n=1 Tax=Hyphomicrobium nitrativorans NL23 TaxID=1029756 RepID=V5S9C3_9HYPH|nr:hypothetical protein [Hyphomicrobium nitrativorans]AHB47238.1 hypothetical protein W911_00630 [Hyphomicrobium nitrativorans NL23]